MKYATVIPLIVACLIVLQWLRRSHADATSSLRLEDFLLGPNGKPDKLFALAYPALLVSSWVIVVMAMRSTLTDIIFGAYLTAWVVPVLGALVKQALKKEDES